MKEVKKSTKSILKRWKKCQELSSGEYAKWLDEEVAALPLMLQAGYSMTKRL